MKTRKLLGILLALVMVVCLSTVAFAAAAPAEVATYDALVAALANGGEIKLTADITTTAAITTSGVTATIDLNGKTLTIGAGDNKFNDASNITIKNGNINITGVTVNGNAIFCLDEYEKTLVTTLTLESVNLTGNGYSSAYGVFYIGNSSVLNVNGGEWSLANDTFEAGGVFKADAAAATLNITGTEMTLHNVRRVATWANTTISNSTIAITGDADGVDAEMEHGFNRTPLSITNSTITMKDMVGRGITAEGGAVTINNSTVTITNAQEATIDVRGSQTVTVDANSTVTLDADPTITSGTVSGDVVVNYAAKIGDKGYTTVAAALSAAVNGDEVKINVAGTYSIPSGKDITITGTVDGVVFDNIGAKNMGGADVTFNNVTFDYYPNTTYTGLQHSGNLTYNNCTINGQVFLYGVSETFNNCTFNQNSADAYNVWTYGAKSVEFNGCTFNSVGKSVLVYNEGACATDLTVTDTDFIASAPVDGKAAIEIDSSLLKYAEHGYHNVVVDNVSTATGFGTGSVSENSLYNNKKGELAEVTVAGEKVLEVEFAAQIGDTKYLTLAEAFTAAVDGDTITLLADVTADSTVEIKKSITLDGNNYQIGGSASPLLKLKSDANITVQNTKLVTTGNVIRWGYVNDGYTHTYSNCLISGGVYGIHYDGSNGGAVVIDGCTIDGFNAFAGSLAQVTVKNTTFDADQSGYAGANFWGYTVIENVTLVDEEGKTNWLDVKTTAEVIGGKVVKGDNEISLESYLDAAAKIGYVYYNILQDAVDAAASGDTIILLDDTTGAGVVFENGDNVIIDLNGKTYTLSESVGSSAQYGTVGFYLWAGSEVTIKNGTLNMVEDQMGDEYTFFKMFHTYGTLTITDVILDCTNGVAYNGDSDVGFIAVESDNGTVLLNGNTSITNCGSLSDETWTVTAYRNGQISIETTGTIDGVVASYGSNATVAIKNGTFTNSNTTYAQLSVVSNGTIAVSGGTFSEDPSAYCVGGYTGYLNADGTYGIIVATADEIDDKATVTITVTPDGATVELKQGSTVIGTAAGVYNLPGGTYTYTVSKPGYYTEEGTITVAGKAQTVTVSLAKLPTLYTITKAQCENGKVTAQAVMAAKGSTIKVSAVPAEGYKVWTLTVTDAAGNEIEIVDGKITMPASNITVSATFVYDLPFEDVADDAENYAAIAYMYENGLMIGTSTEQYIFDGDVKMTRSQIAQILYRLAGEPTVEYSGSFTDVAEGKWYTDAVEWAASKGIMVGVGDGTFAHNRQITVVEMSALIYRYAQCQLTGECTSSDWATESAAAMTWCVENGVLAEGTDGTTIADRNLAAEMFYNVYNLLNK